MATKCPNCDVKFTAREALCHDWKDPNRAFGCPHCCTFFVNDMAPNVSESVQTGLAVGGIFVPGMWVIWRGFQTSQIELVVYGAMVVISLLVLGLIRSRPWKRDLIESPYQPVRDSARE